MKYINYSILVIINLILVYNIYNNYNYKTKENFYDSKHDESLLEDNNLKVLDNESNLFDEFCSKIKFINNNFNEHSRQYILLNNLYINKLNISKKKTNKLLQDIIDYQTKIYNNKDDIKYRKDYEKKLNKKTSEELKVITDSIKSLKNNYNGELIINVT
jgi:hypothetical protein